MFFTDIAVIDALFHDAFKEDILHYMCVRLKIVKRSMSIGTDNDAISETRGVDDVDIGKDGTHRL